MKHHLRGIGTGPIGQADGNCPTIGELHRVTSKVGDDLAEAAFIPDNEIRYRLCNVHADGKTFGPSSRGEHGGNIAYQSARSKRGLVKHEAACLHAGPFKQIFKQGQKVSARGLNLVG